MKIYLYGPLPGFDVLLSRLDAKLHVAELRVEFGAGICAAKCSVLKGIRKTIFNKKLKIKKYIDYFTWSSSWQHYCLTYYGDF